MSDNLWRTKLVARIHDPAEKALVLLRDPAGHEGGSIVQIGKELGFDTHWVNRRDGSKVERLKLPQEMEQIIKNADHWAAAADRPQFPQDINKRYPDWTQVRFANEGEIIHPLSGERYEVRLISQDIIPEHIKMASGTIFKDLIHKGPDGAPDHRLTLLAFWRFGPERGRELNGIGHLWSLLPADTRTPDHTIWEHLDMTSAFAGAMVEGGRPALLTVSLGPVQDFIAAGRSTSDLWAGSHFLSMMAWQAMKVVAEALGPDAILFPQLRGVPIVDLWLMDQGINRELFAHTEWNDSSTDYNPLFGAALPNKFVALVSERDGEQLADRIKKEVRTWVRTEARAMLDLVLDKIGEKLAEQYCYTQLDDQLQGFPEIYWSLVPWHKAEDIESALQIFYPEGEKSKFFTTVWPKLKEPIEPDAGWRFYEPNDGILYPAVHDASERLLAAAKAVRPFEQLEQIGYRDTLTGEHEWLTLDKNQLEDGSPRTRTDTLWARLAKRQPSLVKKGEHLSAFGLIKRLWPVRYIEWLRQYGLNVQRYMVSTHVMALAPALEHLMKNDPKDKEKYRKLAAQAKNMDRASLPRRLVLPEYRGDEEKWDIATRLPSLIDYMQDQANGENEEDQAEDVKKLIEEAIGIPLERYYAILLMDGDRIGAWLSGEKTLPFKKALHSKTLEGLERYNDKHLKDYLDLYRPSSPARHMAISSALNGFSLYLVRHVIENLCLGKLLYSGGDDVMAMVCVRDLPKAMWLLRMVYSGGMPTAKEKFIEHDMKIESGFVQLRNRLFRVMGKDATASIGAVIAHHMAPLGAVLRNLREAEKTAKTMGGRNAFSIRVLKRSGGKLELTLPWWLGEEKNEIYTMAALESLRRAITRDLSRRVAYHFVEMVNRFPYIENPSEVKQLIELTLMKQFERKAREGATLPSDDAKQVADIAVMEAQRRAGNRQENGLMASYAYAIVRDLLFTAEFLAREARSESLANPSKHKKEAAYA